MINHDEAVRNVRQLANDNAALTGAPQRWLKWTTQLRYVADMADAAKRLKESGQALADYVTELDEQALTTIGVDRAPHEELEQWHAVLASLPERKT